MSASAPTVAALLDFAAAHPGRFTGTTGERVRETFGITPARYFILLHRAVRTTQALQHDPITTHRLIREAQDRAAARQARLTSHRKDLAHGHHV